MGLVGWLAADAISIAIICTRGYCRGGGKSDASCTCSLLFIFEFEGKIWFCVIEDDVLLVCLSC
jgi:hypothetical protein